MLNKIIFLDIDGVLALMHKERDEFGQLFRPEWVDNLRMILDCVDANIVISSTWRKGGLSRLQAMWKARRLPGEIIDTTPSIYGKKENVLFWNGYREKKPTPAVHNYGVPRGLEIEYWLKLHGFQRINYDKEVQREYLEKSGIENYVILDDDTDFLLCQRDHFVQCSRRCNDFDAIEGYGLTHSAAEEAIKILTTDFVELHNGY